MKMVYESPMMYVEEFAPNKAVAAGTCDSENDYSWVFDCLKGDQTDTYKVISNVEDVVNCSSDMGFIGSTSSKGSYTAINQMNNDLDHSTKDKNRGGVWALTSEGYVSVTYNNVHGLFYGDAEASGHGNNITVKISTSNWRASGNTATRYTNNGGLTHAQAAPLKSVGIVTIS